MSVNRVHMLGRLGSDPKMRLTDGGQSLCVLIITSRRWKPPRPDEKEGSMHTDWHRVVAWGRLAELCGLHLKRGRQVFVEGELRNKTWTNRHGDSQRASEVKALHMTFINGLRGDEATRDAVVDDEDAVRYLLDEMGPDTD